MNMDMSMHDGNVPDRPARLTREQSRAQTRERIMASAAIVFTREGFAGASIERIAEQAGYSKGAIYSNFASKEVLFLELVDHFANDQIDELCRLIDSSEGAENIIATTCKWASELQHEPDLRLLILDLMRKHKGDVALSDRHDSLFNAQWRGVGTRLLRIFADEKSLPDPTVLGGLVMELAYGNAVQFHSAFSAGDLIGLALRALRDASSASCETCTSTKEEERHK